MSSSSRGLIVWTELSLAARRSSFVRRQANPSGPTTGDKWSSATPTNASLRAQVKSDMPLLSIIFFSFCFFLFAKRYSTFAEEESMSPPCRRIETVAYALECRPAMPGVSCSCPFCIPVHVHVHVHLHVCFQMVFQRKVCTNLE